MSSENELDPSLFKRRQINPTKAAKNSTLLTKKHKEDEFTQSRNLDEKIDEDSAEDSDRTSLSSEFAETVDSGSLLDEVRNPLASSPLDHIQPVISFGPDSPKKTRNAPSSMLQALPPPRPISTIQPISLLGQAIKAKQSKPKNPIEAFARLSGKGSLNPLNIRIYAPFSESSDQPFDMPLQRTAPDGTGSEKPQVIVAEAIGLSLWRYHEELLKPHIEVSKLNVNRWTLRMIEDGEVDYDFPALSRTRPIVDFTSNNNRAARGRSREKPYDEFALVEATEAEFNENQKLTPKYGQTITQEESLDDDSQQNTQKDKSQAVNNTAPSYYTAVSSKSITTLADKSSNQTSHSTPRMGPSKILKIHFTSLEALTHTTSIEITSDTYIAEVLDMVCKRWKLDKAYHILKVRGTNTVAPVDRVVEALGSRTDLDLVRRRFVNEGGLGLAGSPGSSSPNAPLLLTAEIPKKGKRTAMTTMQPLVLQKQDLLGPTARYKKYNVTRKQPMSFAPSHQRVLLMDEDYMHILPGETGKTLFDNGAKTSRVPFSMIVGCKVSRRHPKTFRVSSSLFSPPPFPFSHPPFPTFFSSKPTNQYPKRSSSSASAKQNATISRPPPSRTRRRSSRKSRGRWSLFVLSVLAGVGGGWRVGREKEEGFLRIGF